MNRHGFVMAGIALLTAAASAQETAPAKPALTTVLDQASYAIGQNIGRTMRSEGLDINVDALAQGLRDVLTNARPRLTDEQCRAALAAFQKEQSARTQQRKQTMGEKNKREGQAFLAANKAKQGVVVLPSGLQYLVLKQGNGPLPKLTDTVRTHYHGTLIDGTVFDSSVERGQPATFPVGGVIRGWTESLQKMKVGDKWRLFIPSELAYGPRGAGADIGPHSVLVFDIELLGIE